MIKALWYVFITEMILLLRRSQDWLYPVGFFIIVVSLFPLAFTPDPIFLQKYISGCVWIAALFASILSIETIFLVDQEEGSLEQLLLSPIPFYLLLVTKLIAQWLVTQLPLIILTPLIGFLFHLSSYAIIALMLSLLLGTPILTFVGTLSVAITLGLRQQGILLSLLILPLVTPVLIFGVSLVQQAQAGLAINGALAFLAGISVLAILFLPFAISAAVKIGVEE